MSTLRTVVQFTSSYFGFIVTLFLIGLPRYSTAIEAGRQIRFLKAREEFLYKKQYKFNVGGEVDRTVSGGKPFYLNKNKFLAKMIEIGLVPRFVHEGPFSNHVGYNGLTESLYDTFQKIREKDSSARIFISFGVLEKSRELDGCDFVEISKNRVHLLEIPGGETLNIDEVVSKAKAILVYFIERGEYLPNFPFVIWADRGPLSGWYSNMQKHIMPKSLETR